MRGSLFTGLLALISIAVAGVSSPVAGADADAIIDVDADVVLIDGTDGKCSLREAMANVAARSRSWADCAAGALNATVRIAAGTYALGGSELPTITSGNVRLVGAGASTTVIDMGGKSRAMQVSFSSTLTIEGLTFRNGAAASAHGGALSVGSNASLAVEDSAFEHNFAKGTGGAIYSAGPSVQILRSTFEDNWTTSPSGGRGGAVGVAGNYASVSIANSTFWKNRSLDGGAVGAAIGYHISLNVTNSTFFENDATSSGTLDGALTTVVKNSVIGRGSALHAACLDRFVGGTTNNLTDDITCVNASGFTFASNLGLGAIGLHGGATRNFLPDDDSPLVDSGVDGVCAAEPVAGIDQRHADRDGQGDHCDAGAVEREQETSVGLPVLSATKAVTGDFSAGGTVVYTVVIANTGEGAQNDNAGHEFTDLLPGQLTATGISATSGQAALDDTGGTAHWDGVVDAGASVTITIEAVPGEVERGDSIANQGIVSWDADGDGSNETQTLTDDPNTAAEDDPTEFVVTAPVLDATLAIVGEGPYSPGDTVTFQLSVTNTGDAPAGSVSISDTPVGGISLVAGSVSASQGRVVIGNTAGDPNINVTIDSLAALQTTLMTFTVVIDAPAAAGTTSVASQAAVTSDNAVAIASHPPGLPVGPTVAAIVTHPQLELDVAASTAFVEAGSGIAYTLGYTNTGDIGLEDVVLTETLPAHTTFDAAASSSGWNCAVTGDVTACTYGAGTLTGFGGSSSAVFAVTVDEAFDAAPATIINSAAVRSGSATAEDSLSLPLRLPLASGSVSGPAVVYPGKSATYDIALTNTGDAGATGVAVDVELPAGFALPADAECIQAGTTITCSAGTIAAGSTVTLNLPVNVTEAAQDGSFMIAARARWDQSLVGTILEPFKGTVGSVDLSVSVEPESTSVSIGGTVEYQLRYSNGGTADASGVVLQAYLPDGVGLVAGVSDGRWDCSLGDICTLAPGALAAGEDGVVGIVLAYESVGAAATEATTGFAISDDASHGSDRNGDDNAAQSVAFLLRPDLAVTLSAPSSVSPSETLIHSITVENRGTASVPIEIRDEIPPGALFMPGQSSPTCAAASEAVICLSDSLAAEDSTAFSVAFTWITPPGDGTTVTNAVEALPALGEVILTNNSASAVSDVKYALAVSASLEGPAQVTGSEPLEYTITVVNEGDEGSAVVTFALPAGAMLESIAPADGFICGDGSGVVSCAGNLRRGQSTAVGVMLAQDETVPQPGIYRAAVAAQIFTGAADEPIHVAMVEARADTIRIEQVETLISVRPSAASVLPGAAVSYLVSIENRGDTLFDPAISITPGSDFAMESVLAQTPDVRCRAEAGGSCRFGTGRFARGERIEIRVDGVISREAREGASIALAARLTAGGYEAEASGAITVDLPPDFVVSPPPGEAAPPGPLYRLAFRWTLITWTGATVENLRALLGEAQAGFIDAIYAWDPRTRSWRGFFPASAVPGANDLSTLEAGEAYWIAISEPGGAEWNPGEQL